MNMCRFNVSGFVNDAGESCSFADCSTIIVTLVENSQTTGISKNGWLREFLPEPKIGDEFIQSTLIKPIKNISPKIPLVSGSSVSNEYY